MKTQIVYQFTNGDTTKRLRLRSPKPRYTSKHADFVMIPITESTMSRLGMRAADLWTGRVAQNEVYSIGFENNSKLEHDNGPHYRHTISTSPGDSGRALFQPGKNYIYGLHTKGANNNTYNICSLLVPYYRYIVNGPTEQALPESDMGYKEHAKRPSSSFDARYDTWWQEMEEYHNPEDYYHALNRDLGIDDQEDRDFYEMEEAVLDGYFYEPNERVEDLFYDDSNTGPRATSRNSYFEGDTARVGHIYTNYESAAMDRQIKKRELKNRANQLLNEKFEKRFSQMESGLNALTVLLTKMSDKTAVATVAEPPKVKKNTTGAAKKKQTPTPKKKNLKKSADPKKVRYESVDQIPEDQKEKVVNKKGETLSQVVAKNNLKVLRGQSTNDLPSLMKELEIIQSRVSAIQSATNKPSQDQ